MGATKKAQYKVHNGVDFDKIHFETSEDMIMDAMQSSDPWSGYRVFPPGKDGKKIIIQWGKVESVPRDTSTRIAFPIEFPNNCFGVFPMVYSSNEATITVDRLSPRDFCLRQFSAVGGKNCYWFAIGC